ncbi:MAG: class I SAM-dependent methyltransferase [Chloroflexota bacterium]|nr:class I SAM-dependent methyltransferase [Chloroflexota bacterium]
MSGPFEAITGRLESATKHPLGAYIEERQHALLLEALQPRAGELVVDIGADVGRIARLVAGQPGVRVIATEPSPTLLRLGEQRSRGYDVEWRQGPSDAVPVEDGSADAVLLVTTLEFVRKPQDVVAEARRVLRPGGRMVVGVLSALSPWAALYRYLGSQGVSPWTSARLWTSGELSDLLSVPQSDVRGAVYLASCARPPFDEADQAGERAGNHPAYLVARSDREA